MQQKFLLDILKKKKKLEQELDTGTPIEKQSALFVKSSTLKSPIQIFKIEISFYK